MPARSLSPVQFARLMAAPSSLASSSSAALAPASDVGLPLNEPPKTTPPVNICSMISLRPATTLSGSPPPTALPNVAQSGITP